MKTHTSKDESSEKYMIHSQCKSINERSYYWSCGSRWRWLRGRVHNGRQWHDFVFFFGWSTAGLQHSQLRSEDWNGLTLVSHQLKNTHVCQYN